MDNARLALDYVEVLIWPFLIIAAILILSGRFRRELGELINRIRSVGWMGAQVVAAPTEQPTDEPAGQALTSEDDMQARFEELKTAYGDAVNQWQEAYYKASEQLAMAQFHLSCERIYRVIYGSQIRLLEFLRSRGAAGGSIDEVSQYFQQHLSAFLAAVPGAKPEYRSFVGYLVASGLVMAAPVTLQYTITDYGKGFLDYLETFNISKFRPW